MFTESKNFNIKIKQNRSGIPNGFPVKYGFAILETGWREIDGFDNWFKSYEQVREACGYFKTKQRAQAQANIRKELYLKEKEYRANNKTTKKLRFKKPQSKVMEHPIY